MASRFVHTRCGDDLLSVGVADTQAAQALAVHLRSSANWTDVVPGIDSVVVRFDAASLDVDDAEKQLLAALAEDIAPLPVSDDIVEIPVVYGGESGPDLNALCLELGLTVDEFVALHTGREYRVDMVGFTPGFIFVGGLDRRLYVPRREQPRQHVAAGSVAIADGRTGIYALPSPGGWTLVGRTDHKLFDAESDNPFPVGAGTRIRFAVKN